MALSAKEHFIWAEKYRPSSLDNFIGNEQLKSALVSYIENQDIPHLFFYGPAGTGKTTAAKILKNSIECDCLFINASDENGIDNIRNKVKTFAAGMGFKPLKVVVLDEADFITPQGQAALRNLMEVFSKTTRFILTANYKDRIISPLVSRTQTFEVFPPSKAEIGKHLADILVKENVKFDLKELATIIHAYYPDIRKIINEAQRYTKNGILKVETNKIAENDYKTAIIDVLKSHISPKEKFGKIRQIIADAKIRDFAPMYKLLYDKVDEYAEGHISEAILVIAEGCYKDTLVMDKEINMCATLIGILGL